MAPVEVGGREVDPTTFLDVVEAASFADGSVGWCVMIGGCYATFAGLLPRDGAREIYGDAETISAGAFRPEGVAVEVDGGLQRQRTVVIGERIEPRQLVRRGLRHRAGRRTGHRPDRCSADARGLLPRFGHRDHRHLGLDRPPGYRQSRLCRLRRVRAGVTHDVVPGTAHDRPSAVPHAAHRDVRHVHQRGVAGHRQARDRGVRDSGRRQAGDAVDRHAGRQADGAGPARPSTGARRFRSPLPDRPRSPISGRRSRPVTHPRCRTAAPCGSPRPTPRTVPSRPIELLYTAAGASSVYSRCALDRCLRDARTAVQHIGTQEVNFELAGRHLLGRDVVPSPWVIDYRGEG